MGIRYLQLRGAPRERGRAHGAAMREQIRTLLERWDAHLRATAGFTLDKYVTRYLQDCDYFTATDRTVPHLVDEVRGIADGADIAFDTAFALQISLDEHWHHLRALETQQLPAVAERCSGFAVRRPGGASIIGQNQDLPDYLDGAQVLLDVDDGDHRVRMLLPSIAGFIGLHGMNDKGLAVCVNTMSQLARRTQGMASTFVIRALLERQNFAEAVQFVKSVPATVGLNYIIAGPDAVIDLEVSANQVAESRPHPQRVYHTNHPLVNDELHLPEDVEQDRAMDVGGTTRQRLEVLARAIDNQTPFDLEGGKQLLSSRDGFVCRHHEDPIPAFTFTSAVMELQTPPTMHVTAGPPSHNPFERFGFD